MSIDQSAIAVFDDKQQADLAVRELNRVGFLPEQIAVARQLTSEEKRESEAAQEQREGAMPSLATFFSNLIGLGGEEDGTQEADFRAGRTIVRVKDGERNQEAMKILLRYGGYNRVSRRNQVG
jgi:hypothetical protein